jgi:hypothetical protein
MKIISVEPYKKGVEVVAMRTKAGWYKTHAGISHNCDDL